MIAYYLHSRRPETRDRARAIVDALGQDVVVSSYPAPFGWAPGWVVLTDDSPAALSAWLIDQRPAAVLVDGPAEHVRVATGAGCRVAAVVGPGADPFHALGPSADVVDVLVAPWSSDLRAAAPTRWDDRVVHVGAIGAAAAMAVARRPAPPQRSRHGQWRCLGLAPTASGPGPRQRWEIVTSTPGWQWSFSGERELLEDGPVWDALLRCDVVVCAPTPTNLAAVAAAQVPAVLVLSDRSPAEHLFLAEAAR
ncbi:MAG: hypothetical protein ACJ72D_03590, partial [Marmoricola sp.]